MSVGRWPKAIVLILADKGRLTRISAGAARSEDTAAARKTLVRYVAAGLRAIASGSRRPAQKAVRRQEGAHETGDVH